ncbi:hypothetical protein [Pseudidiomarina gelatinasegens]|uniref:hypothetical protein n=1 Tax=Pseudidiomarina gelatinasegens TaxID=2487740 RepID=UPI003A985345
MKISRKQSLYIISVLIALVLGFALAVWLFQTKSQVDITAFTVAVLSGVISLVALFIALQTYISIDSVNNITKMEGNILDNEYYVTSIPEFIETYPHSSESSLREAILRELKIKLKSHSRTAVDFADTLQSMIDILVLFPAMGLSKNAEAAAAIKSLIADMKNKAADFQAISKGNSIQIQQAVRLFEAVCEYQGLASSGAGALNKRVSQTNGLLKVRGPVLRNPVSATVYHNYLGLYYRKCAVSLLGEKDAVDVASLRNWTEAAKTMKPADSERLKRYLALAEEAFDKALLRSQDDPMWLGYILFNQARVAFIRVMALGDSAEKALALMQAAIDTRTTLNELIADVVGTSDMTVLQQHYLYQEEYSRQLYVNYCMVTDQVATYRGAVIGSPKDYEQVVAEFVAPLSDNNRAFLLQLRGVA